MLMQLVLLLIFSVVCVPPLLFFNPCLASCFVAEFLYLLSRSLH